MIFCRARYVWAYPAVVLYDMYPAFVDQLYESLVLVYSMSVSGYGMNVIALDLVNHVFV